ncbi:MAG: hypothetical protein IPN95_01600 [Bacteroidetes bacterium]|nr:hypothetical protein [Bacteroidota bacterium]
MEPKKKLKLIPIWQFFKDMPLVNKLLFGILFLSLIGTAVVTVMGAENPARWVLEVNELSQSSEEQVALRTYTHNYRTMQTEIGAWKEDVVYFATRITPQAWQVWAFVIAQILGWAFLLASASYVRNFVAYAIFFVFGIFSFLINAQGAGSDLTYWLVNLGFALVIFAPAFLLQQEILKLKFALRVLVFGIGVALPFGLQYFQGGWVQLHSGTAASTLVLVVLTAVYLIFISNDLSNLLFYTATNAKSQKFRFKFPIIFTAFLVISAIEFVMLQKEMRWDLLSEGDDIALRPIHLVALAAVISVGTKQNMGPVLKNFIPNLAMSNGFAALGLISMSFIAYMVSLGEYLFLHLIERFAIIFFFLTGLAHFFYIFYNFGPLIRARLNFYFLSMMPRKLMYFFVVIFAVGGAVALEGSSQASSQRLIKETLYNRLGDDALLRGEVNEALLEYTAAVSEARGSVKGNYNLAMLEMGLTADLAKAREHFQHASDFIPFPFAFLNWGNLEQSEYSPRQASVVLRRGTRAIPNAYLSNNLATAFLQLDEPDSAILEMKEALRLQPENSAFYSNLGRIYMDYDKIPEAKSFLEAGLDVPVVHRATVTNALFLNLRHNAKIAVDEKLAELPQIKASWETNFNFAIDRYHQGDIEGARRLLTHGKPEPASYSDSTASGSLRADSLLLDGMLLFEKGEIARAISRMDFIDVNFPAYRAYTNHFLGASFFGTGSPEMAAAFFRKSVEYGRSSDLLAEAMMEFDRGNLDYAYMQLNLARSQDSTLFEAANLETAKIQLANGDYFFATIGMDVNALKVADWMQIGLAAGKRGNKAAALEAFRRVIAIDPENTAPFVEMARISMDLGDTLALENLLPAIEIDDEDLEVNLVHAQILIRQGDVSGANPIVKKLQSKAAKNRKVRIVSAEFAAAQGDTTNAIQQFESLRKENPIDPAVVLPLSRIYRAKRMDFEGQNMMIAAKDLNPENPDFWYEIAHFERLLVRPEEAGANALEAMKRSTSIERSRQISEEFKEEIASFNALHPGEEE